MYLPNIEPILSVNVLVALTIKREDIYISMYLPNIEPILSVNVLVALTIKREDYI